MKVGAGGLQSMLVHDNVTIRQLDPARKPNWEQFSQQMHLLEKKPVDMNALFKAVERLNQAAQMFNYPLLFKVVQEKGKRARVLVKNKKTGDTYELTPEQAFIFTKQREDVVGKKVDVYG
jgi:hypothetical protein